ncbi:MAG: AAA family ATPase [Propionibacteriaceae bacterium]|nr:AAA family ATPase [Propionibacteriaceae bacterium]
MPNTDNAAETFRHELAVEQTHVNIVYRALGVAIESAKAIQAESVARFKTDRTDWLREEMGTSLFERDAFAFEASRRLAILDAEHDGLVFGRLDMLDGEKRYIGRIGVRDAEYVPLVIDWRAPIAEPFYRATETAPMDVVRRRVLHCRDDVVTGIEDDLLDANAGADLSIIGEGALMAALKRSRGAHMRDIVATIQVEQDEAIRAPYPGVTIISGGPGTGKTVVALHRAAYLLYTHRRHFENGGVLVVGPSNLFMAYIDRVLPGLGEATVQLRSIGNVASDVLGFGSDIDDSADAATIKGSLAMLPIMRRLAQEPPIDNPETLSLRVVVHGEVITLGAQTLAILRNRVLAGHRVNQSVMLAEEALLDALWDAAPQQVNDAGRADFDERVRLSAAWREFLQIWWPVLVPEQLLARLADEKLLAKLAGPLLTLKQLRVVSDSLAHVRHWDVADTVRARWSVSDIALLDELACLLGPSPNSEEDEPAIFIESGSDVAEISTTYERSSSRPQTVDDDAESTYAHVLIDESQDVTPMQWRMLRRRGPQASWTLVGDPAQSSYPFPRDTAQAITEIVGKNELRSFRLSTNYRSPKEVFDLAGRYILTQLPNADLPNAVRKTGVSPLLLSTSTAELLPTIATQLTELAAAVSGSIAVISAPQRSAELYQELIKLAQWDLSRMSFVAALKAKGLEYDGVVVVAPDEIVAEAPGGGRVLYVALTRATQRLVTVDINDDQPAKWRESLG